MEKIIIQKGNHRLLAIKNSRFNGVYFNISFKIGSASESRENNGITHFAEHLIFNSILEKYEDDNSMFVQNFTGYTDKERIFFDSYFEKDQIDAAYDFFAGLFNVQPKIEENFDNEKSIVLEELSEEKDSGDAEYQKKVAELVYGKNPISLPVIGSKNNIEKFIHDDVKNRIHEILESEVTITIMGNIDFKEARNFFEKISKKKAVKIEKGKSRLYFADENCIIFNKNNKIQTFIGLFFAFPKSLNFKELIIFHFLKKVLGEYLNEELRKKGWLYSIDVTSANYLNQSDLGFEVRVDSKKSVEFFRELKEKIIDFEKWLTPKKYDGIKSNNLTRLRIEGDNLFDFGHGYSWYAHTASDFSSLVSEEDVVNHLDRNDIIRLYHSIIKGKNGYLLAVGPQANNQADSFKKEWSQKLLG